MELVTTPGDPIPAGWRSIVEPPPGYNLHLAIEKVMELVVKTGHMYRLSFNDTVIPVYVEDTADKVFSRWIHQREGGTWL